MKNEALPNTRHEAYCRLRLEGLTIYQAFAEAGFSSNRGNAGRLNANEAIKARIAQLQAIERAKTGVNVQSLTDKLELALMTAHGEGQAGAAVSAIMGIAKLHGLLTDKVEHTKGQLSDVLAEIDGDTRPAAAVKGSESVN